MVSSIGFYQAEGKDKEGEEKKNTREREKKRREIDNVYIHMHTD